MKKLVSAAICLSMSALFLTGCRRSVPEVRERAYIQSAALYGKSNISLTLYPFEEEQKQETGIGATMADALENASTSFGKEVFLGHLELLCFDKAELTNKLSSLLYEQRISPSCKLLFLYDTDLPEDCDMTLLTDRLVMEEENGHIPETDLFHILSEKKSKDESALIPAVTKDGFSMCILNSENKPYILSVKAAQGLCWLRGKNYPERIAVNGENGSEDYEIHSAKLKLSAEINENIPCITARIIIKGSGDEQAAKAVIESQCNAAARETIKLAKADVIGLFKCLARYCPEYYSKQETETAKWDAAIQCTVEFE